MPPRRRRPAGQVFVAALVRAAPFVLGAVAAAAWMRRRHAQRPALPMRAGAAPGPAPAAAEPSATPPPAVAREPARSRTSRFERSAMRRFERANSGRSTAPKHHSIDIVTVVDDLLGATHQ